MAGVRPKATTPIPKIATTAPPRSTTLPPTNLGGFDSSAFQRPRAIVLIGKSGIGKTSLCAEFPNCKFICDYQEFGILDLKQRGLVRLDVPVWQPGISTFSQLLAVCDQFIKNPLPEGEIETLVFESISGFERLAFQHRCKESYQDNWDRFSDYSKGAKTSAKRDIPDFVDKLEEIRNGGRHVVLTGHSQIKQSRSATSAEHDTEACYGEDHTWQAIHKWAETVIFITDETQTVKAGTRNKATENTSRYLRCDTTPLYASKNRWGIQVPIPAGTNAQETFAALCRYGGLNPATFFFN